VTLPFSFLILSRGESQQLWSLSETRTCFLKLNISYFNAHLTLWESATKYSSTPEKVGYKHSCYRCLVPDIQKNSTYADHTCIIPVLGESVNTWSPNWPPRMWITYFNLHSIVWDPATACSSYPAKITYKDHSYVYSVILPECSISCPYFQTTRIRVEKIVDIQTNVWYKRS
jgi:hypothetical protein